MTPMRALILQEPGNLPKLSVMDVPEPTPGADEALVRVEACGFCHHDRSVMAGLLRRGVRPGVILGHEIVGVIEAVGAEVDGIRAGDRVVTLLTNACGRCDRCLAGREHRCRNGEGIGHGCNGGFAEYVAVSQHSIVPLPGGPATAGEALLACPIGVALQAVDAVAGIQAGETVVVTGAGGGLGVHAVQAAAALAARVLAVTSSPGKSERLRGYGADEVIETGELDFSEIVAALTGDERADVVIDTVGSALFPSTLRSLGQYGRLVLLGEVAGGRVEFNPAELIFRDIRLMGTSGSSRADVENAADMTAYGYMTPVVDRALPLEEADQAFELLSNRATFGRVLLTPA